MAIFKKNNKKGKADQKASPKKAPAKKLEVKKAPVKKLPAKKTSVKKVEVKKAKVEKKTTTKKTVVTKAPTNIYYLSCRKDNKDKKIGWEIKRGNSKSVSAVCQTKEEAKIKVKEFAKNSKATVIIYKTDGKIDETYKIG